MRITRLSLYNFGIYAGNNTLNLKSQKPVILIGGMNGRGKTTILEAILFALYGRRSFAFVESGLTFHKYLRQRINTSNGNNTAKIELEFTLPVDNQSDTYIVKREWRLSSKTPSIKTTVMNNGMFDKLLSENWDLFIEETLPSALAPFFFFDGEKISDLANSDDDTFMKESIKTLLGINVIETAANDVQRIVKNHYKDNASIINSKELTEYESKLNEADNNLKIAKEEVGRLDAKRIQLENKLEQAENTFSISGGNLAFRRKELFEKQVQLNEKLKETSSSLLEMAAGDLPLLLVTKLLERIADTAEIEKKQHDIQAVLEQLPSLFKSYDKKKHTSLNIDDFINYIKNNTTDSMPLYNLTDSGFFKLQTLCATLPNVQLREAASILVERDKILTDKATIENHLTINVNEDETAKTYEEILKLTADLATVKEQLRLAQASEETCNFKYNELSRQLAKIIENTVSIMEEADDAKRILTYSGYSVDILQEYKIRLQFQKAKQLAATMTDCFNKLVSKRTLLKEIKIDEYTLQFYYYNNQNEEISHSIFSAGEKQLLVIAMLWALGICSKKNFPIIVDTPLARLDSVHRMALIENYFPKASEQIILLSTDEEIYGKFHQLLIPFIGKEYTLHYEDDMKQSSIESGYFGDQIK